MEQLEFFDIPNPCKKICQSNSKGFCIGCYRNREERMQWHHLSNESKRVVLKKCQARRIKELRLLRDAKQKRDATNQFNQPSFFE